MRNNAGEWFYRLRGLGEIHDPNDFGQLLVCAIPLMFIFWRAKKMLRNFAFVILQYVYCFPGSFLRTRAARSGVDRRCNCDGAAAHWVSFPCYWRGRSLLETGTFCYRGWRDISESGRRMISLWGEGMQILKAHPLSGSALGAWGIYR